MSRWLSLVHHNVGFPVVHRVTQENTRLQHQTQAKFDASELAVVLSNYDLGVIESVTEFLKGSRRSPKVGIVSDQGKFLLKRRSLERAKPQRVRFSHLLQAHLSQSEFPLCKLIPTRKKGDTILQIRNYIYELFEFVPGHAFDKSIPQTHDAGITLAKFHRSTATF